MENNKCSKYEGLFIFQDEEKLNEHLENCADCRNEHQKHLKISSLIKEAAPVYLEREEKKKMMHSAKKLACCLMVFIGLSAFTGYKMYDNYVYQESLEQQDSIIAEMGLPVDEYGFLSF